jgi:hypothetical protein
MGRRGAAISSFAGAQRTKVQSNPQTGWAAAMKRSDRRGKATESPDMRELQFCCSAPGTSEDQNIRK